jgi:hypothetical protein
LYILYHPACLVISMCTHYFYLRFSDKIQDYTHFLPMLQHSCRAKDEKNNTMVRQCFFLASTLSPESSQKSLCGCSHNGPASADDCHTARLLLAVTWPQPQVNQLCNLWPSLEALVRLWRGRFVTAFSTEGMQSGGWLLFLLCLVF